MGEREEESGEENWGKFREHLSVKKSEKSVGFFSFSFSNVNKSHLHTDTMHAFVARAREHA